MNNPVSFELAKLLKEKGFNGLTHTNVNYRPEWYHIRYGRLHEYDYFNSFDNMLKAPTIAEVVCWIYSKYQIWIQVSILKDDEWHYSIRRKNNNWNIEFPTKEKFTSIENAYEKGINVVLNTYKPTS